MRQVSLLFYFVLCDYNKGFVQIDVMSMLPFCFYFQMRTCEYELACHQKYSYRFLFFLLSNANMPYELACHQKAPFLMYWQE